MAPLPLNGTALPLPGGQRPDVDFSKHAGLSAAFIELKAVRQSIADKETREAELKQMLQQAMGDASRAEFTNGYVSWRKAKTASVSMSLNCSRTSPTCRPLPTTENRCRRFLVG
jgi:hypothetical protein